MGEYRFQDIQMILCHSDRSAHRDITTFKAWAHGDITLKECFEKFQENNNISDKYFISMTHFESWLNSLGYYKRSK